jgi:hypothetical protein
VGPSPYFIYFEKYNRICRLILIELVNLAMKSAVYIPQRNRLNGNGKPTFESLVEGKAL